MSQASQRRERIYVPQETADRLESVVPLAVFEGKPLRASIFRRRDGMRFLNLEFLLFSDDWQSIIGLDEENVPKFMGVMNDADAYLSENK